MKLWFFLCATLFLVWYSIPSFKNHTHGVPRFFAFEGILLLVLVNADSWFVEPFSLAHTLSWIALLASLLMAIHGFYLLHAIGKPRRGFENTTNLVEVGAYKYIRHPLYCSLLLGTLGVFLKNVSVLSTILAVIAIGFLFATAKIEERENVEKFGTVYEFYMSRTARFIPFLY